MDVMGWSKIDMAQRYMHLPDQLRHQIAAQLGGLLWTAPGRTTMTTRQTWGNRRLHSFRW